MNIELQLKSSVQKAFEEIYGESPEFEMIQVQKTRREFEGDFTIVVFPLLKFSKKPPEQTADEIGSYLKEHVSEIDAYNVVKGFLNLVITCNFWVQYLNRLLNENSVGVAKRSTPNTVMVEFSSPNTNKPLHLGHIRNNLLGYSVSKIVEAAGDKVVKVNLVNDRGIHICKSMLAWEKWGNGETPESAGKKGDHLVGDYYVRFDQEYKKQIASLVNEGMTEEEAKNKASLIKEAREMLKKWEAGDENVNALWKKMNDWVYQGFDETYNRMGVAFDKTYHESETYKLGKEIVLKGLEKGILFTKDDGSVWADLTEVGLDEKLLLRADGTSVYMTQDIGTAIQRFEQFAIDKMIYVVGNEQNYHFQVLRIILGMLGYSWSEQLHHLSYGMVELPEGKMKSREGKVVDADDLMDEMIATAKSMSEELGKLDEYNAQKKAEIIRMIGLGALKYFILKVDPKKTMTFNPKESVDFNGNTGPFIQYTYARIQSVKRKAQEKGLQVLPTISENVILNAKELQLVKMIHQLPEVLHEAAENLSPAILANYSYDLAKEYNQFYHDNPIVVESDIHVRNLRYHLSHLVGRCLEYTMGLLGIEMPERM